MRVNDFSTDLDGRFGVGTQLLRQGDLPSALGLFKRLYAEAEAAGNAALMAACLCEIAWTCFKLGDAIAGLECVLGAKWLWRRLENPQELARALAVEAILFLDLGFADDAYVVAEEATDLARAAGDHAVLAFALNARALTLSVCRESELAMPVLEEATGLADALGHAAAAGFYRMGMGFVCSKLGDEAAKSGRSGEARTWRLAAIEHTLAARVRAEAAEDCWTERVALCNAAEFLAADGRSDEAVSLLRQWNDIPGHISPSLHIHHLYTLGAVLYASGALDEAETVCSEALALAEQNGQVDHQVNAAETLSAIREARGDAAGALAMQKRFHALYVRQSGEASRKRARVEEIRSETRRLRAHAERLAGLALSDPLTSIANRRSFDQILNRLAGSPMALCLLDLDHFKQINDVHSHIVGDAVLQFVARILVDQVGRNGHAARLGGEEFALIFPDAPPATAAAICEGVRVAVCNADWSILAPDLAVSVSIGVAASDGTMPAGALMQIADRRLYEAKSEGRNRVRAHPSGDMDVMTGRVA
ncbi:MAG: hypothetical protein ABS75_05155 [Pelagibacterium sp. SCN 63-23]|nr:MAG: hypothetical protein ABS75_05155 [Pelagibacterium sp. SCN 63-23]